MYIKQQRMHLKNVHSTFPPTVSWVLPRASREYKHHTSCIITIIDYYCMSHIIITCNYEYYH
jgi:hypothetical protein